MLEIGFGSGCCLQRIAHRAGRTGKAFGLDLSPGMIQVARRRLRKGESPGMVELCCGDAANLPYHSSSFDAVFMSFTLELFDTPEIPIVVEEVKRVLKSTGRFGVVGMSREGGNSGMFRLYEWAHQRWPRYADCRPIYVEGCLVDAGYKVLSSARGSMVGLPVEIVIAARND